MIPAIIISGMANIPMPIMIGAPKIIVNMVDDVISSPMLDIFPSLSFVSVLLNVN